MMMLEKVMGRRYTVRQVGQMLGVKKSSLCRWMKYGLDGVRLQVVHIGKRVYITESDLEEFLVAMNTTPGDEGRGERLTKNQMQSAAVEAEQRAAARGFLSTPR